MSKPITWRTQKGEVIPISRMADSHLINTIRYLRKTAALQIGKAVNQSWAFLGTLNGEMAQDAMDQEIARLEQMEPLDYVESMPIYQSLVREAKRRKLKYE